VCDAAKLFTSLRIGRVAALESYERRGVTKISLGKLGETFDTDHPLMAPWPSASHPIVSISDPGHSFVARRSMEGA